MLAHKKNEKDIQSAPKTLCIVQLARIGDLIQTYMATKAIKSSKENSDLKITLVARKKYATPLMDLLEECFDSIILLDYEKIMFKNDKLSLDASLAHISEFTSLINKKPVNALVNLTFSKTSCYLSNLIKSEHKLGVNYDQNHNLTITDHWSQYAYSNVLTGPMNPFSLVDIFSRIIGSPLQKISKVKTVTNPKNIVIHPFTSQERKHWKPTKWSEIIFNLLKTAGDLNIKIVGSADDSKAINDIIDSPLLEKYLKNIHDISGKTSIIETLELVRDADLFIGHDSMVSHLAAVAGTKSITIALGTVRPVETAPYAIGNYVLSPLTSCFPCFPGQKCEQYKCHTDISFQTINTFLANILKGKNEKSLLEGVSPFHTSQMQIYKTGVGQSKFLSLEPLIDHHLNIKSVLQKIYRIAWLYMLTEEEELSGFPSITQGTAHQLANYKDGIKHLFQISEFGKKYSTYILQEVALKTPSLQKIKDYSKKIVEVDGLQLQIKDAYPLLSPVIDYYAIVKSNLVGENIVNITESAYISYENCSTFCNVLNELIEKTIGDYTNLNKNQTTI